MTDKAASRPWRQIVAALAGVSLLLSAVYMLYQGSVRMYYDYYSFAHVKEHHIAPPLRNPVIDAVVLVSLFFALYVAFRLLRHSFVAGAQPRRITELPWRCE
jgi:hypothetical protein